MNTKTESAIEMNTKAESRSHASSIEHQGRIRDRTPAQMNTKAESAIARQLK
jgi:hypothetical protein